MTVLYKNLFYQTRFSPALQDRDLRPCYLDCQLSFDMFQDIFEMSKVISLDDKESLKSAKRAGFSDFQIAKLNAG